MADGLPDQLGAIACGRSDAGTSSGCRVWAIGPVRPWPTPIPQRRISSTAGVTAPVRSSAPSPAAASSITNCLARAIGLDELDLLLVPGTRRSAHHYLAAPPAASGPPATPATPSATSLS
ncbi:MAG: hypothetical protein ACLP0J_00690 [Solirubrobacteraceae bacterium]